MVKKSSHPLPTLERAELYKNIIELYNEGQDFYQIAQRLQIAEMRVAQILMRARKAKPKLITTTNIFRQRIILIAKTFTDLTTAQEIAARFHCTYDKAYRILREAKKMASKGEK